MDLAELRRVYARQILAVADASEDTRLEDAFARVPRENFLGEGKWRILTPWSPYTSLPHRDPALIYQDVVVALDEERGINNGSPSLHARWMHLASPRQADRVAHIGAGTGYYSAILAELVSEEGYVTAVEYDEGRAARAKENLCDRHNVEVVCGNGFDWPRAPVDVVYVNFAATRPALAWVDNLRVGGRLILPLGVPRAAPHIDGKFALNALAVVVTRLQAGYEAAALGPVSFVFADGSGAAEEDIRSLRTSLEAGGWQRIKSLVWNSELVST